MWVKHLIFKSLGATKSKFFNFILGQNWCQVRARDFRDGQNSGRCSIHSQNQTSRFRKFRKSIVDVTREKDEKFCRYSGFKRGMICPFMSRKVQTLFEVLILDFKLLPKFPSKLLFGLIEMKEELEFNWSLFPWLQMFIKEGVKLGMKALGVI